MKITIDFKECRLFRYENALWFGIKIPIQFRDVVKNFVDDINAEKDYRCELHEKREKRSLDQNAYMWELLGQLSAVLKIPPKELYREYIKDVGGNYHIGCFRLKDVDNVIAEWESNGDGWVAEDMGESKKTEGCHNVKLYFGSSHYDTAQMSRLLDYLIADCKDNGIQTEVLNEEAEMPH